MKKLYNYFMKQFIDYDSDRHVKESVIISDSQGREIKLSMAEVDSYLIPHLKKISKDVEDFYRNRYLELKKQDFDDAVEKNDLGKLSFYCIHNKKWDTCEYYCNLSGKYCDSNCGKQELYWKHEC